MYSQISVSSSGELVSDEIEANDLFGTSIEIDGDYMVVGAQRADSDNGALYVFHWDGSSWMQEAKLTASIAESNRLFGLFVDIEGDVIVTGDYYQSLGGTRRGAVFVYEKPPGGWADMTETAIITASDIEDNSFFGSGFSLDGDQLAVGRSWRDGSGSRRGAVYIYRKTGSSWADNTEEAILTPSTAGNNLFLGYHVFIEGDMVLASATGYSSNQGAVYYFKKSGSGWTDGTELNILTPGDGQNNDSFGERIRFLDSTLVVTSSQEDGAGSSRGATYIFTISEGNWVETESSIKLTASDAEDNDIMGIGLALDNETVFVSSIYEDGAGSDRGKVYVFRRPETGWQTSTEDMSFTAADAADDDIFGQTIAVGDREVFIGSRNDDYASDGGKVYIYDFFDRAYLSGASPAVRNNETVSISFDIDDNNLDSSYWLEYGTSSGIYTLQTSFPDSPIIANSGRSTISEELSFESGYTYYARVAAQNSKGTSYSGEFQFTLAISDKDGVDATTEESGPNSGDGNYDGIADAEQASVATLPGGVSYITVEIIDGCAELRNVEVQSGAIANGYSFPYSLLSFDAPCDSVRVRVIYHGVSSHFTSAYRKTDIRGRWFDFEGAEFSLANYGGNQTLTAELTLTDGEEGDYDLEANGYISDPGGPSLPISNIPVWDWWWIALILAGGWVMWRRNHI